MIFVQVHAFVTEQEKLETIKLSIPLIENSLNGYNEIFASFIHIGGQHKASHV